MSPKKIYIVRHGQTDFNLRGIVQGSGVDSSLNELGQAQAIAFHQAYQSIQFDKIYTSALQRTKQSVQPFLNQGISHEAIAGLNEISWGTKEGFPITPEEDEYYHYMLRQWQLGHTSLRIEKGESPDEVLARLQQAMEYIMGNHDEQTILICMHGRAIRILLCYLLNYPLKAMDMFEHQNLGLYQLNFTGTMYSVAKYNDTLHLRSLS